MSISKEEYKEALSKEGILTENSIEVLNLIYDAPNCNATTSELAASLGYSDFAPVNSIVGKLGKRIANYLDINVDNKNNEYSSWYNIIVMVNLKNKDIPGACEYSYLKRSLN